MGMDKDADALDAPSGGRSTDPGDYLQDIPDLPPDLIEGFELLERIAEGGMGAVFRARQVSLDREVAIKVLKPRLALDESFLTRFNREAKVVARLNHPNVVRAIDVGEARGWHYLVMEYVDGETLQTHLDRGGKLTENDSIRIAFRVCRALKHAHANGLVHRDIKPDNILISKRGEAKLCDLGLAKDTESKSTMLTLVGTAMGTPRYVSPEQAMGKENIDIRSDIYSLGATLYHMLTGRPPFETGNAATLMARHISDVVMPVRQRNPGISEGTAAIIGKMLQKDPADRHQTPQEVIEDLRLVAAGRWTPAPSPAVTPVVAPKAEPDAPVRRGRFRRRRR